jgi:hypothetical protein
VVAPLVSFLVFQSFCQGLVPWATSYDPRNMDMTLFLLAANDWRTKYPILDMVPPLLAEGEGPST